MLIKLMVYLLLVVILGACVSTADAQREHCRTLRKLDHVNSRFDYNAHVLGNCRRWQHELTGEKL